MCVCVFPGVAPQWAAVMWDNGGGGGGGAGTMMMMMMIVDVWESELAEGSYTATATK